MLRSRPGLMAGLLIAGLVLAVAGGLFAIQYGQALAACTEVPRPDTCAATWPPPTALNAVFASALGLLGAIVMAITVGVSTRRDPAPNVALMLRLEEEERAVQEMNQRRAQYNEWMIMAAEREKEQQAQDEAAQQAAREAQAEAEVAAVLAGRGIDGEEPTPEQTMDQKRREVMAERLLLLAKNKPETVAEVLKGWINQPSR